MFWRRDPHTTTPASRSAEVDDVLAALRDHPIATEATDRLREKREAARREHLDAIAGLDAEAGAANPLLRDAAAAAARSLADARAALLAAERAERDSRAAVAAASERFARLSQAHRAALLELADPAIEAFIVEMRGLIETERGKVYETPNAGRSEDPYSGAVSRSRRTNAVSLGRRADAVRAAIVAAEGLKAHEDQRDVGSRLNTLREALPPIQDETFTHPKPVIVAATVQRDHRVKRRYAAEDEGNTVFAIGGLP